MNYYEVAPNQIVRADKPFFTYASNEQLAPGHLVKIEVGKKQLVGLVLRKVSQPSYDTKEILEILESQELPEPLVNLALWLSEYYATHLATVLQTILPRGLAKKRRVQAASKKKAPIRERTKNVFTAEQTEAIEKITSSTPGTLLLHGVTGSGKTAVYIEAAKRTLSEGKSVIVLVPEIALTSQLVDELSHHFDQVILAHSGQTEAKRHLAWHDALVSDKPRIVVGPRSALFLPLKNIGLIVIDEAHEPSFKQEQSPRYHALRAASFFG